MQEKHTKTSYSFKPDIFYSGYILRSKLFKSISIQAQKLKGKMLDFGCGSKPYRSLFDVDEYVGVDFMGEGHSHENEQIDVFYDGKTLPFPDDTFDSVFSSEVFEHVFNLEEMVVEIKRVMKPGALILVTCPFAIPEHEEPNDYARYSSFGLKHLFLKNGFSVDHFEKIGNHWDALVQLRITLFSLVLLPKLNRIPVLNKLIPGIVYFYFNIKYLLFSKLFQKKNQLYLNNLIICKKL